MNPADSPRIDLDSLALLAARGEKKAETALFSSLRERFLAVAKRRVREDELEDVVQDALRIALTRYAERPGAGPVLPWGLTVLRNVIGNRYQARRREEGHVELNEEALVVDSPGYLAGVGENPLADHFGEQLRARVADAIRELGREHSRCAGIFRRILEGLDCDETPDEISRGAMETLQAGEPGVSRGNFYVVLHRCRARLRQLLDDAEPGATR